MRSLNRARGALALLTALGLGALGGSLVPPAQAASTFPIGIVDDTSAVASWWNAHAQPADAAFAQGPRDSYLSGTVATTRLVYTGSPGGAQAAISAAQAVGATAVGLNDETTNQCATLASNEASFAASVHASGRTFVYIPTGRALAKCVGSTPALVTQADWVIYQTEYLEGVDATYQTDVHRVIGQVRAAAPTHPVWAQVSVNPPANTAMTAAQADALIDQIQDGSANQADGIFVWYAGTNVATMEQAIAPYRP